ncbi:MAG: sensor histidine kinase [Gaiellaceae bacterium]
MSTDDELRTACARVIAVADGDRRSIERALHDGVQQDLIALSIRVQLARQFAGTDLPAAISLLDEVRLDVRDALNRVQALANEIYPSVLEARGLPDALRGAATAARVAATVEAAGVGRHSTEVEVALYFLCRAALAAVAAHAGTDARVTIRIREEEHALQLEVAGDTAAHGAAADLPGFTRDRIAALGGTVTVDAAAGHATRFAATVPLV